MVRGIGTVVAIFAVLLTLSEPAHAVNDRQIRAAVNAAVAYLKSLTPLPSSGASGTHMEGPIALAGIALMEAGVDSGDPFIQKTATVIRERAVSQSKTYQLALDIIFLDKLGEQIDTTLIQSMGARLLRGQSEQGGWGYNCPGPDDREQARLTTALNGASMKGKKGDAVGLDPSSRPQLDPAVNDLLRGARTSASGPDDNSNTQFALLGVWAARRHGVPVDDALGRLERRLRSLQNATGGWGYLVPPLPSPQTPSMTCAGLLGLAVTAGNRGERSMKAATIDENGRIKSNPSSAAQKIPNLLQTDRNVIAGFNALAQIISGNAAAIGPRIQILGQPGAGGNAIDPGMADDLYFMWSLERVCMVYGVPMIGNRDWYAWGAEGVVATQRSNGSWMPGKSYGPEVDTCFALMFLCRSNIVKDLSNLLANRRMTAKEGAMKPSTDLKPPAGGANVKDPVYSDPTAMAKALATASGAKYAELLKHYTESKGPTFTQALAEAIPQMSGESQKQAREALAERMARFSADTVKERLRDDNPELRRAAALAVYMRDERGLVPNLIDLLNDPEDLVVRAARLALKGISEKDFGPSAGATAAQKQQAVAAWKNWWDKNKK